MHTRLGELLSEPHPAARLRESSAFDSELGKSNTPIVVHGAGVLGRKVLGVLLRHGYRVVAVADRQASLWGTRLESVPVMSLEEAALSHGRDALVIVCVFRGSGDRGMAERLAKWRTLGCPRVTPFLSLAWKFPSELLPHFGACLPSELLLNAGRLEEIGRFWGDEVSRSVCDAQLAWRLRADFSGVGEPSPNQYFPQDLFSLSSDERLVDCGAFDGDTLRDAGNRFAHAWAIEPDPVNAERLRANADPRVSVVECAVGDAEGVVRFEAAGTVASAVAASGGFQVPVRTLDHLLAGEKVSFLKMDIEGAELGALHGARKVLASQAPLCAICAYHRPDHLIAIPGFLSEMNPGHALFLRSHQWDGFELVVYSVPPERRRV